MDNAIVVLTVATAVVFDFTNGFHDTANAMATTIATRALPPRAAVGLASVLNFAGAFISVAVAATIASGIVEQGDVTVPIIFAGLVGAILWNVTTWFFGIPSSSSHALVGGVVGAVLAGVGSGAVIWSGIVSKVLIPAVLARSCAGSPPSSPRRSRTGSRVRFATRAPARASA
jgi:PiT family inorganic phosphate transporter